MKIVNVRAFNFNGSTIVQAFKKIFFEYCTESSIHGFKYVGGRKRTTLERIIWFLSIVILVVVCCYLISNIWEKRKESPIIVTFNDRQMSIWEIPFPTVTICPQTKTHTRIFNYTKVYWKIMAKLNVTEDELYFHNAISQTCLDPDFLESNNAFNTAKEFDILDPIRKAAPTLNETIILCYWLGKRTNCWSLFEPVWTDEGMCFSFNSINSQYYRKELFDAQKRRYQGEHFVNENNLNWVLEHGFNENLGKMTTYPQRAFNKGDHSGLVFYLATRREDEDSVCRKGIQGYKIILDTPGEEPNVGNQYKIIPFDQSISISIRPTVIETSESLRNVPIESRKCYFQNERYLRYFTVYTQGNCESECLANYTISKLGCVRFAMPRNVSHQICGRNTISDHEDIFSSYLQLKNQAKTQTENINSGIYRILNCQSECFPTCTDIKYEAELETQVESDLRSLVENIQRRFFMTQITEEILSNSLTELKLNFKTNDFNSLRRSELYSETDFIANCGGLLGLCMGVSILSFVELVYFFTVKLFITVAESRTVSSE